MEYIKNNKGKVIVAIIIIIIIVWLIYSKKIFSTSKTFANKTTLAPNRLVLYYTSWCKISKDFLPEWKKCEKYVQTYLPTLEITSILCDENQELCDEQQIKGYPTIILYAGGNKIVYAGERSVESIVNFIKANIKN